MEKDRRKFWRPLNSGTVPTISSPLDMLQDGERCMQLEDLLPGIHDQITLDTIASKLSWKDFHVLLSVSRGWRHAIRSRQVYDARVGSQTRETVALISYGSYGRFCKIALYSTRDRSCYLLPPIPSLRNGGIPLYSQCVSLDGKVYVLGGRKQNKSCHSRKVYVLDLAGQRQWKQCASMGVPRCHFKCGVINRKIFAFGRSGSSDHGEVNNPKENTGEVYDPKDNTWSPIRTMMCKEFDYDDITVEELGQELFLYGRTGPDEVEYQEEVLGLSIYHPAKTEWAELKHFNWPRQELPFLAQGSFHSISADAIHIHDVGRNSWRQLHIFSFAGDFEPMSEADIAGGFMIPISVRAVEDELLVLMQCCGHSNHIHLLHSKGFSDVQKEILLERAPLDVFDSCIDSGLCSICLLQL